MLGGLFCLVRLGEANGWAPGWVRNYGDDLLCLPVVLSLVLAAHRLGGRPPSFVLPLGQGLLALLVIGVYFEGILPAVKTGAVGDPLDLLMYLVGFLFFQFALNGNGGIRTESDRTTGNELTIHTLTN